MAPMVRGLWRDSGPVSSRISSAVPGSPWRSPGVVLRRADALSIRVSGTDMTSWLNTRPLVSPAADREATANDPPPLLPKGVPVVTTIVTGTVCAKTLSGARARLIQKAKQPHSILACRGQRCLKILRWRRRERGPDMHDPPWYTGDGPPALQRLMPRLGQERCDNVCGVLRRDKLVYVICCTASQAL